MTAPAASPAPDLRSLRGVTVLLAVGVGLAVANLYYAQPLLDPISASFSVSPGSASVVLVVTQLGYAAGMVLVAPLGDLLESRRLASRVLLASAVALSAAAASPTLPVFALACVAVGVTSVVAQILVPLAAHLAPEAVRGQLVGRVMTGLLLGILLARTVASLLTAAFGWRSVYVISAVLMLVLSAVLTRLLPQHQPVSGPRYGQLLRSLYGLVRDEPALRWRGVYQALMFGSFSVFWTAISSELVHRHGFSQSQVGLFALVGAAGAAAAPLAGRLGDRGHVRAATGGAFALAAGSLVLAALVPGSVVGLAVAAIGLDLAVQTNLVLGQRVIYSRRPEARSRMNTVYITAFFLGGAAGSAISGTVFDHSGWRAAALAGAAMPAVGLLLWVVEGVSGAAPRGAQQPPEVPRPTGLR